MRWRLVFLLVFWSIHGISLPGCAPVQEVHKSEEPLEVRLERDFFQRGLEYERQGQPHRALQAYEAALAVILDKKNTLEASLREVAEQHYQQGLKWQEEGKFARARKEFLIALRLWSDYPEVVQLLRPAPPPSGKTNYLVHKVEKGEYLSAIAQKYYNDQSKFDIIAHFNNLEDPTKLYVGMELKIPEIEGVNFQGLMDTEVSESSIHERIAQRTEEETAEELPGMTVPPFAIGPPVGEYEGTIDPEKSDRFSDMAALEMDDYQVDIYQEQGVSLLEAGQYLAALHEFQKVLNIDPNSEKTRDYMVWAHYRQGDALFRRGAYLGARHHFKEALSLDHQCTTCKEYLERCEDGYKEERYLKGIEYFEEEKLEKAMAQWQLVKEFDPDYRQVQDYLLRAEKLMERIQQLKEKP